MTAVDGGLAVAFPGQGVDAAAAQAVLRDHAGHPLVDQLAAHFGADEWSSLDFGDTRVSQPCTFLGGLLNAWERVPAGRADLVIGHSLGEITAATFAGAIDPAAALALVIRRGEVCHHAQTQRPGAMVAVMGVDPAGVEWARRLAVARTRLVLEVAAVNGPRQTVLSGDADAVAEATRIVAELQGIAQVLPIGGAFHSPLMLDALPAFEQAVAETEIVDPGVPLLSSVDGQLHLSGAGLASLFVRALLLPVRWLDATTAVVATGVEEAWDAGPGRTLHKLARRGGVLRFVDEPVGQEVST